jgi:hypothetical protein
MVTMIKINVQGIPKFFRDLEREFSLRNTTPRSRLIKLKTMIRICKVKSKWSGHVGSGLLEVKLLWFRYKANEWAVTANAITDMETTRTTVKTIIDLNQGLFDLISPDGLSRFHGHFSRTVANIPSLRRPRDIFADSFCLLVGVEICSSSMVGGWNTIFSWLVFWAEGRCTVLWHARDNKSNVFSMLFFEARKTRIEALGDVNRRKLSDQSSVPGEGGRNNGRNTSRLWYSLAWEFLIDRGQVRRNQIRLQCSNGNVLAIISIIT